MNDKEIKIKLKNQLINILLILRYLNQYTSSIAYIKVKGNISLIIALIIKKVSIKDMRFMFINKENT